MKKYSFVKLNWKDYRACKKLLENVFHISEIPFFINAWRNRSDSESFLALDRDVIVGFGLVDNRSKLQYICVDREYQNEKIGSQLLERIIDATREKRSLWLTTGSDERLVGWYGRYGFRVIKRLFNNSIFTGANMVKRNRCRSADK